MIKYIKEHKDKLFVFFIFLLVFMFLLSKIMVEQISNLDELWNYNIARNISKGLIPYKDISMITTPLLSILEAIIIKITADELYVFRIMNAILITGIIFLAYRLLFKLNNNKIASSILSLAFLPILNNDLFLDYNFFILFLMLIIVNLEIKQLDIKNNKIDFLIGMLGGLSFCTKQTVGIVICAEIVIFQLIKDFKEKAFKRIIYRIIGIIIPIVLLSIYLLITNSFSDFLSYTFLSIGTFDNSIPYSYLLKSDDNITRILACLLPSYIIGIIIYLIIAKDKKTVTYEKIFTIFVCALPLLFIEYPIFDRVHFMLANFMIILIALYSVYLFTKIIYKKTNIKCKEYIKIVFACFIILYAITKMIVCIYNNSANYFMSKKNNELKHYSNLIVSDYIKKMYYETEAIEEKYEEQNKKVNILDSFAVVIHIPMDKYIKNYDMFNKGNLGKDGEDGVIENIKNSKNNVYLIKRDGLSKNWQNPNKITEYIQNNLNKIDETELYYLYE